MNLIAYHEISKMSLCKNQNMEVIIMTLGEKLKEARKKIGLSQEQLAEKLSVSRQAVSKWESDKGISLTCSSHKFLVESTIRL